MNVAKIIARNWVAVALIIIVASGIFLRVYTFHWPYLRNIDSYMFYRYMGYVVETGNVPPRDMLMTAPVGWPLPHPFNFFEYLGAYSYMFIKILFDIELWQWMIWFPSIIASLVAIPSYYAGKALYDRRAGLFTAFFMVFATANVSRSLGGDADSDAVVILLPMVVMAAYLLAYKASGIKKWVLSAAAGIALAVFAYTWTGYWYTYWIITGFVALKIAADFIAAHLAKKKYGWKDTKDVAISLAIANMVFFALAAPYYGINFITDTLSAPISTAGLFTEGGGLKSENAEFPNVYVSVQELISGGQLKDIVERTGNVSSGDITVLISPFMLTIYCFAYMAYSYYRRRDHLDSLILLMLWFIGAFYSSTSAVRFTIMLVPVFCIGSGILFSKLWATIVGWGK